MGLSDFLKPKNSEPLGAHVNHVELQKVVRDKALEVVEYCRVLTANGQQREAVNFGRTFLNDLAKDCPIWEQREFNMILHLLYNTAIKLNDAAFAKSLIDIVIHHGELADKNKLGFPAKDLTAAYMHAGQLAHEIPDSLDEAYRCFWMSAEAKPPSDCKHPARTMEKANAHMCAKGVCSMKIAQGSGSIEDWIKRRAWHDLKMREYEPGRNWDYTDE